MRPLPYRALIVVTALGLLQISPTVLAQEASLQNHEKRLRAVEDYLETLPPSLTGYVGSLEESIEKYTKNLESGLQEYSELLETNLETRLLGLDRRRIEIDRKARSYQKIETATGMFFIATQDVAQIDGGYRLFLQIGNPHYANFKNFTLRIVWGERWFQNSSTTYQQWRNSLVGSEFKFNGRLEKGTWTPIEVDLVPAQEKDIAYIECELGVDSIELEMR